MERIIVDGHFKGTYNEIENPETTTKSLWDALKSAGWDCTGSTQSFQAKKNGKILVLRIEQISIH